MKLKELALVCAVALLSAGCSSLDRSRNLNDPRVSGQTIAQQVCSICHGIDGNSVSPQFPKLAGQQKTYIVSQLKHFRAHNRLDPPGPEYMWGLTRHLTDPQIDGIAEYFSGKTMAAEPGTPDPLLVAAGRKIFENGFPEQETPPCKVCHGPTAQGLAAFPRLGGQHIHYLIRQLHVFRETNFRPNTPMTQETHALTAQQMVDVATYLSTLAAK